MIDNVPIQTPFKFGDKVFGLLTEQSWVKWLNQIVAAFPAAPKAVGTATVAISPHLAQIYVFNRAGVVAATLVAPTVNVDDGTTITVTSDSAQAHTLTATGLLDTGTASINVATFAAFKGAGLTLLAYNGRWKVLSSVGITFS